MSRRPGIGAEYLARKRHMFRLDYLPLCENGRLVRASLPRYCEKLFPEDDWISLKERRLQNAFYRRNLECALLGLSPLHLDDYKRALAMAKVRRLEKTTL